MFQDIQEDCVVYSNHKHAPFGSSIGSRHSQALMIQMLQHAALFISSAELDQPEGMVYCGECKGGVGSRNCVSYCMLFSAAVLNRGLDY